MQDVKRETIRIDVFNDEQYGGEWPTSEIWTSLADVIGWFQRKLAEVPEEYRAAAKCEIDSSRGYEGSHCGRIRIWYERPETDEELFARHEHTSAEAGRRRRAELETLRALQRKYPNAT